MKVFWGTHEIAGPKHLYRMRILLKCIRKNLGKKSTLIDVGCGSGSLLFRLAAEGYRVHGVDISKEYVLSINARLKGTGLAQTASASVAQAEDTGLESQSANGIILSEVLEHLPDEGPALAEAYRLLKPDGWLFVTVPADPGLWTKADGVAGHYRRYRREELKTLIAGANFNRITICSWGQAITKVYEKLVFSPWMGSRGKRGETPGAGGLLGKLAKSPAVSVPLSFVLAMDSLLPWPKSGIGWVAVAQKP